MTEEQRQRLSELRAKHFVNGRRTAEFLLTASYELLKEMEWLLDLEEEAEFQQQKLEFLRKKFVMGTDDSGRYYQYYLTLPEGIDASYEVYQKYLDIFEEFVTQFYSEREGDS